MTSPADTAFPSPAPRSRDRGGLILLGGGSLLALVLAVVAGDLTTGSSAMDGMSMTHYMGLLSVRQPWNLLLFMALPVVLAEILAISEMVLLLNPGAPGWVGNLSRWAGLLAGPVWVFITVNLLIHAVYPLTVHGQWRGAADVIAVSAYLLGALPMLGISLLEAGLLGRSDADRKRLHVTFVAIFLVVAHVAMIMGMLDPTVLGWSANSGMDHSNMPGMNHDMGNMPGMDHSGMTMPSASPTR